MGELEPQTRIARADGWIVESLGADVVMLNPEADRYLRLNATGGALWRALERPATVAELGERLAAHAGIDPERAGADAAAFASDLVEAGAARIEG